MGANADQTICDYSNKELLIPTEETEMIPRAALICHCLSLYERLSWHRSKRLMQNGQNPFKNVLVCGEFYIVKSVLYWKNICKHRASINVSIFSATFNSFYLTTGEDIDDKDLLNVMLEELKGINNERLQLELNALIMIGPDMQPEWR